MKKILFLSVLLLSCFAGCKKDDEDDDDGDPSEQKKITVTVVDEDDQPIVGAKVKCGTGSGTTSASGTTTVDGAAVSDGKYNVEITADGYFNGYQNIIQNGNSGHHATVKLIAKQQLGTVGANSSATLDGDGFNLSLTGGGFKYEDGSTASGEVSVYGRYVSADNPEEIAETMPGGDFAAVDNSGGEGVLESYGFTAFEFADASGKKVVPNNGNAKVAITVSPDVLEAINQGDAKVWYYNTTSKKWSYGGDVNVVGNQVYMPVTSSTFGNCDAIRQRAKIKGKFYCKDLKDLSKGVKVKLTGAEGYAMVYTTHTNNDGEFLVEVGVPEIGGVYKIDVEGYSMNVTVKANETKDIGSKDICGTAGGNSIKIDNKTYTGNVHCNEKDPDEDYYGSGMTDDQTFQFVISGPSQFKAGTMQVSQFEEGDIWFETDDLDYEAVSGTITISTSGRYTINIVMEDDDGGKHTATGGWQCP